MASNVLEFGSLGTDNEDESDDAQSELSDEDAESGDDDDDVENNEDDDDDEENQDEGDNESGAECENHSFDDGAERECCPVCLNKFIGQELGTPESCEHTFCFDCIKEWSKNINTCPIDRNEFNFIYLRAIPGGSVLKKVKVNVRPKEVEETLQESATLCEICHSGAREDRLLLCDGCDLAFHCECLDPPLFYIPIEEWFCPPCSGVLQDRAIAGPSCSRRRVIPRTRASETVRSRVQNMRTGGISTPRSSSWSRKSNTTKSPRKRKRRTYRRTFKKVVQLARTKKDISGAQKSKLGARGSTIIVTYRRKKRRRRTAKRKFSRRSLASTKALPVPSTKQRIAKRLGISKPLEGSSLPQVKQPVRSYSSSRVSKMPTHSIFGDRNQLMDFNENFNDDIANIPSTSKAASYRRSSNDSFTSSSSLNVLDSIMAGQKLLYSKSNNIVIKTDGSLILKKDSNSKKEDKLQKLECDHAARMPMSVALVKSGVKCLASSSDERHSSVWQKNANTSKSKNATNSKTSNSSERKIIPESKLSSNHRSSKHNCSNSKSHTELSSNAKKLIVKGSYRRNSLSTVEKQEEIPSRKNSSAVDDNIKALMERLECDTSSNWESKISYGTQNKSVNKRVKSSGNSSFYQSKHTQNQSCSDRGTSTSVQASKSYIKKEVLSDDETDADISSTEQITAVKIEVLSDDETNIDTWIKNNENNKQETDNRVISRIKTEPIDSDSEADVSKNHSSDILKIMNDKSERSTYETEVSDFEASQSIINTLPNHVSYSSLHLNSNSEKYFSKKVKEEVPSDTEDYSQSLVSIADANFVSQSFSSKFSQSAKNYVYNEQGKQFSENPKSVNHNLVSYSKSNACAENYLDTCTENEQKIDKNRKNTNTYMPLHSPVVITSSSEDEAMPCTQVSSSPVVMDSSSEDDDIPCTQVMPSHTAVNNSSEDEDLPCTQPAPISVAKDSSSDIDDLPCTQAVSLSFAKNLSDDDDAQVVPSSIARSNLFDDDDLPCTQAVSITDANDKKISSISISVSKSDKDFRHPSAQVVQFSRTKSKGSLNSSIGHFSDEEIPPTQINFDFLKPDAASASAVLSAKKFGKSYKSFPPAAILEADSVTKPQCLETSLMLNTKSNTVSHNVVNVSNVPEDLPTTQSVGIDDSHDLPATQISNIPSAVLNVCSKHVNETHQSSIFHRHQVFNTNSEVITVSDTQVEALANDFCILPSTQPFCSLKERNEPKYDETDSANELFSLPATQIFNPTLKGKNSHVQSGDIQIELFSLPATKISNQIQLPDIKIEEENSESFTLPPTQINNVLGKAAKECGAPLLADLRNESTISSVQHFNSSKVTANILDTRAVSEDSELYTLPPTQISNINSNLKQTFSGSSENSHGSKLMCSKNVCSSDECEKSGRNNMNDIILNIKQIVHSLSINDPENLTFQDTHSAEKSPHDEDHNISDNSLDCKKLKSDLSVESTDIKDTLGKTHIYNNSTAKDQESLQSNLSDCEGLSHTALKAMASKLPISVQSKSVGTHKHLPQVIAKLPVKEHVKLKPSNRRTFSFEEVVKSEEPEKTPNNLLNNSKRKVSNKEIHENMTSIYSNVDDEFPPTQRMDFGAVSGKPAETKMFHIESHLNSSRIQNSSSINHELNHSKINEDLNDKSGCNSTRAVLEENEDFPATQLALCKEQDESALSSSKNEIALPVIQNQQLNDENFSGRSKTKEHVSNVNKIDSAVTKNKRSVNIISIKSCTTAKQNMHKGSKKSSKFLDVDDLPATQVFNNNATEENSLNVSKHSLGRGVKSKYHQSNSTEINYVSMSSKEDSMTNKSARNKPDVIPDKTKELSLELEFNDFPPTQAFNNNPQKASRNILEKTMQSVADKSNQNSAHGLNNCADNISSVSYTSKSNPSKLKKLPEAGETSNSTSDRKCSFNIDMHKQKKKDCDLKQNKKLYEGKAKENKNHNRGSKRSLEYEKDNEFGEVEKCNKSLSSKRLKWISDKEHTPSQIEKKCNSKTDNANLLLPFDLTKELPSERIKDKSVPEISGAEKNLASCEIVTVKQEKINHDISAEAQLSNIKHSSGSLILNGMRIKSEDTSDFLPATQVANITQPNYTINDTVTNSICLSSSSIKIEVCSDDEVSIIEVDVNNKTKVKEEIIIDDDDESSISHADMTNHSKSVSIKCEKEVTHLVPTQTELDMSSVKKEKCFETNEENLPKSKHHSKCSSSSFKQPGNKHSLESEFSTKGNKKSEKNPEVSKYPVKSHKTVDKSRSSKDSCVSKENKQKKGRSGVFKSKPESTSQKQDVKCIEKSKNSKESPRVQNTEKRCDLNSSCKPKFSSPNVKNSLKLSKMELVHSAENQLEKSQVFSDKQRSRSSEKENNKTSVKNNCMRSDIVILKSHKKRTCESSEDKYRQKRGKYDCSSEASESCSSENSTSQRKNNGSHKRANYNVRLKANSDLVDDRISNSTPRSDISTHSFKELNAQFAKESSKNSLREDVKKMCKQDLKEEIANEVKLVLKPFFNTALISKDDYKDIMRRAVPKIFMNCHNCINPEKIRKLVHSYVSLLNKC